MPFALALPWSLEKPLPTNNVKCLASKIHFLRNHFYYAIATQQFISYLMSKLFVSFTFFTSAERAQIHWVAFASKSMSIVRQRLSFRRLCRISPALSQRESPSAPAATLDGVELGEQISTTVSLLLFQPRQNMW